MFNNNITVLRSGGSKETLRRTCCFMSGGGGRNQVFKAAHCSPKMLQLIEISANCDDGGGFVLLRQRTCDILNEDVFF